MPLVPYALTSVAAVKERLGISTSSQDTMIEDLINECTDWIESYCGDRRFVDSGSDIVEIHDGNFDFGARCRIFVRQFPIFSVTKIEYSTGSFSTPVWNTLNADTQYKIDARSGIIYMYYLPVGRQNLRITYRGGYLVASIPYDLQHACIKLVSKEYLRRNSEGASMEGVGGASVKWELEVDPSFKSLLSRYKKYDI